MEEEKDIIIVPEERYLSTNEVKEHVVRVREILENVMVKGEVEGGKIVKDGHYSQLPGCGDKLVLLKPGAEKLCLAFNLVPRYQINILPVTSTEQIPPGHRDYEVTCELFSRSTGNFVGQGMGSCTTMESKYRKRGSSKACPKCGQETIFKSKFDDGGWYCFDKKGGCGAKFKDGDASIEGQITGKIDNPDIADVYNTVKKMACKRALVHAVIQCLAVGDIFMQDVEDMKPEDLGNGQTKPEMTAPQSKSENKTTGATEKQTGALHGIMNQLMEKDTPENVKHEYVGKLLKLDDALEHYSDLTKKQASTAIDLLNKELDGK